jgi:EAL domain-containing protein (putative c-di-GMP-specific phosphodiesterase class I)/GGDEF domain-containing protein
VAGAAIELVPRLERRPEKAAERFAAEPARVVVVDARGALAHGLAAAQALGEAVEARQGAMLVLLSRGDGGATAAAHDAGATGVLVSPFGAEVFGNALRLAMRHAGRLADAAAAPDADPEARDRHDSLTGLATGNHLQAWIAQALARDGGKSVALENGDATGPGNDKTALAEGGKAALAEGGKTALVEGGKAAASVMLLAVGVGRFAQINAAYGRAVADRVLAAVALRLSQIVDARALDRARGDGCLLARLAAAEFAVAVTGGVGIGEAIKLANALARGFDAPFLVDDHVIHLSARIGIASSDDGAADERAASGVAGDAATLMRRASSALVEARNGEAGTIQVFRSGPEGDPLTRIANLESDLHRAIECDDISVLYQPQLGLATGQILGVEALVRWEHPEHGLLSAETLLGTAATAELAIKLGRHIRARAMVTAARWTGDAARLRLSVNVTAADLADPGFAEALEAAREAAGLARNRLTVEVTEGAFINDIDRAIALLAGLRAGGIKIALDDFGTGYSSLALMARLPIDIIKLDRSFTMGLTGTPRERVVVETMVRLSKQLGLNVIAEGVEDDMQLEATRLAGCDGVQGYRVAAAMDVAALQAFCDGWQAEGGLA